MRGAASGLPKSPAEWDAEYRTGSWDYLEGIGERSHHMVILGYILGLNRRRRVLDVGCGTGSLLELGRNFPCPCTTVLTLPG